MKFNTYGKAFLILFSALLILLSSCNQKTPDYLEGFPPYPDDAVPTMDYRFEVPDETLKKAGLPIVKIRTEDRCSIVSKEDWIPATMDLICDTHSNWEFENVCLSIRGRGNSSWYCLKKPFALKFDSKTSVCGMPSQKRWVLLANYLDNSFMKNEMAFYLSRQLGMEYTVRGQFVNLVLNGNYVGMYWLGEQIRTDKNRVNIDDNKDYLIEMDQYFDETWKFRTDLMQMPAQVKNDDKMTQDRLTYLKERLDAIEAVICNPNFPGNNTFTDMIDIDSFAKFFLVNQIMYNLEISNPKSFFLVFDGTSEILKAGPVWDFDWSSFSTDTIIDDGWEYFDKLNLNPIFRAKVKELLDSGKLTTEGVSGQIRKLYSQINIAAQMDRARWGEHPNSKEPDFRTYDEYVKYLELCINTRLAAMKTMSW